MLKIFTTIKHVGLTQLCWKSSLYILLHTKSKATNGFIWYKLNGHEVDWKKSINLPVLTGQYIKCSIFGLKPSESRLQISQFSNSL